MAGLKNSSNFHSKRLTAVIALISANPGTFAAHFVYALKAATMGAYRTFGPQAKLYKFVGVFFVVKIWISKYNIAKLMAIDTAAQDQLELSQRPV